MAVLVQLDASGETPRERVLNTLEYSHEFLDNIGFEGRNYEVWKDSYLKEKGGEKLGEFTNISKLKGWVIDRDFPLIERLNFVFDGSIKLDQAITLRAKEENMKLNALPSKLYVFNRRYRRIMGVTAIFYTFTIPDWRLFYENSKFKDKIKNLHKVNVEGVKLKALVLGKNQFAIPDIREHIFCYYLKRKDFIYNTLRTIKEEIQESREEEAIRRREIPDIITPYNLNFIASTLDSFKNEIENRLKGFYIKNEVTYETGSIKLTAIKEDAFLRFYEDFRDDFVPFFKREFADADKVVKILRKWVQKVKDFKNFQNKGGG